MKLFRNIAVLLILFTGFSAAQVITMQPEFATENDSIVIIFDATEADGRGEQLVGYTGTLYAHTGVKVNDNGTVRDWQYVIGTWGQNSTQPDLERIGTDLYQLTIGYPRDFYGITDDNVEILQLNFVFRTSTGANQSEDIFQQIFVPGLNISISQPAADFQFKEIGDTLDVRVISENGDSTNLYIGGIWKASTTGDTIEYQHIVEATGLSYIIANAYRDDDVNSDTVSYLVNEDIVEEDLPRGIELGINYVSDTSVVLALMAPLKENVYVIGDFNDWTPHPDYFMKRTLSNSIYWLEIGGLQEKTEYGFQYFVDGELRIADPYTHKILHNDDQWIEEEAYPNLKPYPGDKTEFAVSVLEINRDLYEYTVTDFQKPDVEDLVVYELHIRDFIEAHDYAALIDTLNYLDSLGINAIELMPINEFEGNDSWGYNPTFYFAVDKYYGPENDFRRFVDECHKRGIAVILDMVLNHSFGQSPMVRLYNVGDYGDPTAENPWYNQTAKHDFNVGYDFNHESPLTREFSKRVMEYWIEEYKIDGYRFDLSKGFTQKNTLGNVGEWGAYDQSRIDIWNDYTSHMKSVDTEVYVILEHFADNNEERVLANNGMMIWGNMTHNYQEGAMGYNDNNKSDLIWSDYSQRGWNDPHLVAYMESHDEERIMYKNLQYGNSSGDYDVQDLPTALDRAALAAAFHFTMRGPKMLWQFGELGYDFSIDYNERTGRKPIRWDYYFDQDRRDLYSAFRALIKLKTDYDIITNDYQFDVGGSWKEIKYNNVDGPEVHIIGNFAVTSQQRDVQFRYPGEWYDYFTADTFEVSGADLSPTITLEPGEFRIYTSSRLPKPDFPVITSVRENGQFTGVVEEYGLQQNYPNPFNPTTNITYSIPEAGFVSLKIYNSIGQEVKTLVAENKTNGVYEVTWDGTNVYGSKVTSGIYFYRITSGDFSETKKMILLK